MCCKERESNYYYSLYGKDDQLIEKNKYVQTMSKIKENEYNLRICGNKYNESLKIKIDSLGIYWRCSDHFVLTYHFDSLENQSYCKTSPPFIYKNVYWVKKKNYLVKSKSYEIICYSEVSSSESYNSAYYLKGFGFICYYSYKVDKYILCDSISNVNFDCQILLKINESLIHDSTMFEKSVIHYPKVNFFPPNGE
jgi:hypothetical protein